MDVKRHRTGSPQVGERLGVLHRTGSSERFQRLQWDNPRRDRGAEVLGEKWSQRYVLPALDVAGAPVVDQHQAEDVIQCLAYRDGLAEFVAGSDDGADLQLEVDG